MIAPSVSGSIPLALSSGATACDMFQQRRASASAGVNDRAAAAWLASALTCLYLIAGRGHFIGTDEIGMYQQTRSLFERGDLAIGPVVNAFVGRDGRWYSQYAVGQSVLALPLYALGSVFRERAPASGPSHVRSSRAPSTWRRCP